MSVRDKTKDEFSLEEIIERNEHVDPDDVEDVRELLRKLRSVGVTPETYKLTSSYRTTPHTASSDGDT